MSKDLRKRIHLIYGIAYIAVTVIAGICFILSAQNLYQTGVAQNTQPYTRELIAQAFSRIAIPVYLCLVMTIGGFILQLFLPMERKKLAPEKNRQLILSRLQAKTDLQQCDAQLRADIEAQRKARKLHSILCAALLAVCSIIFLVYACAPGRWPAAGEIIGVMIEAVWVLAACAVLPLGYAIFTAYFCRRSLDKEIALMRQATPLSAPAQPAKVSRPKTGLVVMIARYAILVFSLIFIIYGFCNGGIIDVIAKAAKICTECIGLG